MTARVLVLEYPIASEVSQTSKASQVRLALETKRGQNIGVTGGVKDAELFRDALLTLVAVMKSDLRYKGKDRTAYLAFLMKKGKKATAAIWEAQKSFLEGAYGDATPRARGLDPVVTVDPDEVSIEVFSRDESAYARLAFSNDLFDNRTASHGTTLGDISPAFVDQLERVRTYQRVELEATTKLVSQAGTKLPREVDLPDEWLRGFLQVQSAAALPSVTAPLAAIDLYNVLFVLRVRKAKKAPRALRFELVPGMRPRIVIEPWEIALDGHGVPYAGKTPRIVRIFGRQRLLALALALPHLRSAAVHLLGPGLPSFWVLDMGLARLTVALTSWSESRWASAASFDALMPRAEDGKAVDRVVALLRERGPLPLTELASGESSQDTRNALQRACLQGRVLFDIDRQVYRPRALLADPVDESAIRYGSAREAQAHRLLEGEVEITKLHLVAGEGQEVSGEVEDKAMHRKFSPRFFLDTEGQVKEAWCNCPTYMRSALREGPCEHMIALRVKHQRDQVEAERLRTTPEGRKLVHAETRTFMRRESSGGQISYRVSLDDHVVRIERQSAEPGHPLGDARHQRLWFDTDKQAREAYFARLDGLTEDGFIDTDATA